MSEIDITIKIELIPIEIEYQGKTYKGTALPMGSSCKDGVCYELEITLNGDHLGILHYTDDGWKMDEVKDQGLVNAIGEEIQLWYE